MDGTDDVCGRLHGISSCVDSFNTVACYQCQRWSGVVLEQLYVSDLLSLRL